MEVTAPVSGLSLQSYCALHEALTGTNDSNRVRNISVLEEAFFKSKDLQLVLSLVGLTDGSRKKREVLDRMEGCALPSPFPSPSDLAAPLDAHGPVQRAHSVLCDLQPGDLWDLGLYTDRGILAEELQAPPLLLSRPGPGALELQQQQQQQQQQKQAKQHQGLLLTEQPERFEELPPPPAQPAQQSNPDGTSMLNQIVDVQDGCPQAGLQDDQPWIGAAEESEDQTELSKDGARSICTLEAATSLQGPDQAQNEGPGKGADGMVLERPGKEVGTASSSQGLEQVGSLGGREHAGGTQQDGGQLPQQHQQQQELQSLEWLAREVLQFSQEAGVTVTTEQVNPAQLLGRRVGFLLPQPFEYRHPRTGVVEDVLQAGIHIGAVSRLIGAAHQPDMCEQECTAAHNFFVVRVLTQLSNPLARIELKLDLSEGHRLTDLGGASFITCCQG